MGGGRRATRGEAASETSAQCAIQCIIRLGRTTRWAVVAGRTPRTIDDSTFLAMYPRPRPRPRCHSCNKNIVPLRSLGKIRVSAKIPKTLSLPQKTLIRRGGDRIRNARHQIFLRQR